ncbi:hypothetical protein PF010_g30027 [Phytophthora fragariae]|uniref:Uncharacterized protein n=2 Tax=Phytophthora TaxID=4783 RepID=A0A6A3GXD6_9STRA|nr:hypothetical protein PR002_g30620 [Phytophthora rubi]KAE8961647.1 hypothetical protein PF011_g29674 [Phytophthora fragariae]KAE8959267.1 hypothetical protein PR001_g30777 [Phytophthora rubi]KAE9060912.1 hypothetical protein PF010_g30027 [Phytophthora fragariae]KAE9165340.1 hypothetical protein PF004_g29532 [Phytophthora fragariae]
MWVSVSACSAGARRSLQKCVFKRSGAFLFQLQRGQVPLICRQNSAARGGAGHAEPHARSKSQRGLVCGLRFRARQAMALHSEKSIRSATVAGWRQRRSCQR